MQEGKHYSVDTISHKIKSDLPHLVFEDDDFQLATDTALWYGRKLKNSVDV